jgi:Big-like domain-containing protein
VGRTALARARVALLVASLGTGALVAGPVAAAGAVDCPLPATAADNAYSTKYGKTLVVVAPGVLANDHGTGLKVDVDSSDSASFGGSVEWGPGGRMEYTPDPGFAGEDSFDYWVVDACENEEFATVTVEVRPIVGADKYTVAAGKRLRVGAPGVLANDQGVDSVWTWPAKSAHGGTVTGADDGSFSYVPKAGFSGTDTFAYEAIDTNFDNLSSGTVTIKVTAPPRTTPPATVPSGYWMVESGGKVHPFGAVRNYGNARTTSVTHFEPTATHKGYWIVDASGTVSAFGDAKFLGNANRAGFAAGEIVSSLSATPTGQGYWLFTSRGRALAFGDAKFYGDMRAVALNGPVVGSVATPTGRGYYMVGSDGGIFTFGDAVFRGSMGAVRLNQPVQGLVPTADNKGYWLVASDGGIFNFGNAVFRGSMGAVHLNRPIVGMVRYGNGYLMVGADGGIFNFSNQPFLGSLGANPPTLPVVSVAA